MSLGHILLALLVAAIWGLNFVVVAVGLHSMPPLLLAALRFMVAGLPIIALARPSLPWPRLISIASTLFIGQFGLLFTGMAHGMPPGMASVVLQAQAVFTAIFATVTLHERPTTRQALGIGIAVLGLGVIGLTIGSGGITALGMLLTLGAAVSWSFGNIQLRAAGQQNMLAMIVWLSVIPPLPLLGLSLLLEGGPHKMMQTLATITWPAFGAILYIGVFSTILGYGMWGHLLKHYRATTVAPFALLVPIFAAGSASLLLGEQFGETRLLGMGLILAGLAAVVLPAKPRTTAPVNSAVAESS